MRAAITKSPTSLPRPENIFPEISHERGAIWLDSSLQIADKGRYSFLARNPVDEISAIGNEINSAITKVENLCKANNVFAIGFISYETGIRFLELNENDSGELDLPLLHFFIYESVLKFDHLSHSVETTDARADDFTDILDERSGLPGPPIIHPPKISGTVSKEMYLRRINKIKEHIREGDIYQANYTCRFDVKSSVEPYEVYGRLRKLNPSPYSAYLNFGDYQILSSSPERMFRKVGNQITSCPIKGTISTGNSLLETEFQKERLLKSEKDRAELLMIVDLMRNDIGKIARTNTVEVDNLFAPEIYSSVIHLVADVTAELNVNTSLSDILKALMPGGSITGTPKKRAVEILQKFEKTARGIYTGCIGYVDSNTADFNIAIRTILHQKDCYYVHAGGGIVADSDPESEYNEMQLKARNLFKALGASESQLNG